MQRLPYFADTLGSPCKLITKKFTLVMDIDLFKKTNTSSRQILTEYWNIWYSMLKCNKKYLKENISFDDCGIYYKKIDFCKQNDMKNKARISMNLVDLNKNILLNTELKTLQKYWYLWKAFVKANGSSEVKSIKFKRKTFDKLDTVENESIFSTSSGLKEKIIKKTDYKTMHRCLNLWRSNQILHKKLNTSTKIIKVQDNIDEKKNILIKPIILVDLKNISPQEHNKETLRFYWDVWRENTKPDVSSISSNKIDHFLSAVLAEKKKTIIKHESHLSLVTANKENKIRNTNITTSSRKDKGNGDVPNETLNSKGFSEISLLKQGSEKNLSISSIKSEVKISLKRAHSLLENTIVSSFQGNCARRKNFNHHVRKGSPTSFEMADSDVLERMKNREMERARRWQLSKERRQAQDKQKEMKILEEEREKLRQKEQSKKLKWQELREKKQQEIEHQKRMEETKQKSLEQNLKAQNHLHRRLLLRGMNGFRHAIDIRAGLEAQARRHHEKALLQRIFMKWKNIYRINENKRLSVAVNFYNRMILKSCYLDWAMLLKELTVNKQTAVDFYGMRIQEITFFAWNQYTCDTMVEENLKLELAEMLYRKSLIKKSFHCWKRFPAVLQSERAREKLKNILRQKVIEIIPDFCPEIEDD